MEPHFIKWLTPLHNESLQAYAARVAGQINTPRPVLLGLSFGGMVAAEVARLIAVEQLIIIASAKTRYEIPPYYRLSGWLRAHSLVPTNHVSRYGRFNNWLFGAWDEEDKKLLASILGDTDPVFLKWAISQIIGWRNTAIHPTLTHIHGSADRIFPIRFVKPHITIPGGGHLMTINMANELNRVLAEVLKN